MTENVFAMMKKNSLRRKGIEEKRVENEIIEGVREEKQTNEAPVLESFGFEETSGVVSYHSFDEMNISGDLLRGIYSYGWEKPSPIQQKSIVPLCSGRDIIAQAQSGTGKTGAFTIGSVNNIVPNLHKPQVLMLSPVRDLAVQTYILVKNLLRYTPYKVSLVIGMGAHPMNYDNGGISGNGNGNGNGERMQERESEVIDWNAEVIVGTPGRVLDVLQRNKLTGVAMKTLIVDEADEMLSKGFKDQLRMIFRYVPRDIQVGLFSATMPEDILELTEKFLREPLRILVKKEMLTLEGIRQYYIMLSNGNWKMDVIHDLYETISVSQTIIFCNSKQQVMDLKRILEEKNHKVAVMHGGMTQVERNHVMEKFRIGELRILISTDILSRGIDIQQISLIINYDLPYRPEPYLHRIGRSGRYGRKGIAINLITTDDYQNLRLIEKFYNTQIEEMPENFIDYLT